MRSSDPAHEDDPGKGSHVAGRDGSPDEALSVSVWLLAKPPVMTKPSYGRFRRTRRGRSNENETSTTDTRISRPTALGDRRRPGSRFMEAASERCRRGRRDDEMNSANLRRATGMSIGLGSGIGGGLGLIVALLVGAELPLGLVFGAGIGVLVGLLTESVAASRG